MIIPLSFYALVYYRFRCIVERPVDEIGLAPVLHFNDNVLTCVSFAKDVVDDTSLVFCFWQHLLVLKLHICDMLLSQEQLVQELNQQVFAVFLAEDSFERQSENGLMYLAISLRFYVLVGKDTTFPRNFQGFREKILEKDGEKEKNRRLPELRAAYNVLLK